MRLLSFILAVGVIHPAICQSFRLTRPVPDSIQTNGSYLYGEPRLNNNALAHTGIDIAIAFDTVRSASEGKVWFIGYDPNDPTGGYEPTGCGNYIFIQSTWNSQPLFLLYCHLTRPLVALNDQVQVGTPLAISGTTGNSTGPHLHFELRLGSAASSTSRNRRNPELWTGISGMGAIYGTVPGAPNSTRVDITPDPKPRPPYTTFGWALTYNFGDPGIGSDDFYQENYAVGDVKPGRYVVTALSGTYRRDVVVEAGSVVNADVVDAAPEISSVPDAATLSQNYPNPFNPVTRIEYALPGPREVRLSIVDVLGREVCVLAEGPSSPGSHTVMWDASPHPSGMYVCRFTATDRTGGTTTRTIKLLLVR